MLDYMTLILGDCLVEMKKLKDDSIDLLFCDLPYGQTSCKWDCEIDLSQFWTEVNRICKDTTPMFFTCSTKFGNTLINSNPKHFKYDLVWIKSSPCGFLNAKKMPMKKHEMVYVFYKKLPMYDLSSHTHKFLKEAPTKRGTKDRGKDGEDTKGMIINRSKSEMETVTKYEPSLPTSVLKEDTFIRGKDKDSVSDVYAADERVNSGKLYHHARKCQKGDDPIYDPALPTSVLREECESLYGAEKGKVFIYDETGKLRNSEPRYDPPLPHTVLRETDLNQCYDGAITYNYEERDGAIYDPPLPHSILEIKSEKGKHPTQKPTALIEWCLKYYSKEGDMVLDPCAGSGSTGVACKNMNRNYICIEKDPEIFKGMEKRLG